MYLHARTANLPHGANHVAQMAALINRWLEPSPLSSQGTG